MKLTVDAVKKETREGLHADGKGLYLKVQVDGSKSWIYRYQINGHRRSMGLGGFPGLSLASARKARDIQRLQVSAGVDPLQTKRLRKEEAVASHKRSKAQLMTFQRCSEDYINQQAASWKSRKHEAQWTNTLATYANPVIGRLPVEEIETAHLLEILKPIWLQKTETATRVRNRIELVLDYAAAMQYRSGENPARWRGNLAHLLPKPSKVREIKHHPALPYSELPEFMSALLNAKGLAARALTLTILCATRTSETLNAEWSEINMETKVWTIPKERMKQNKTHRVPLSNQAITLLEDLKSTGRSNFVFPGSKRGKPLSNMAMTICLSRMGRGDITVHGFRSTFRDWVAEKTNYPQRVAETALAHRLKDGAEAAYQRGDLLEKRKQMMDAWAQYALPETSNVVVAFKGA
jgi:integrase